MGIMKIMMSRVFCVFGFSMLLAAVANAATASTSTANAAAASAVTPDNGAKGGSAQGWDQSFKAGATDQNGHYMGGAQIIHMAGHEGRLFAGNSYWCDSRNIYQGGRDRQTGWAQVLRLDRPGGPWTVDLELGPQYLRVEVLKSVTFRTDGAGKPLPKPAPLLLAGTFSPSAGRVEVSLFARNDATGKWTKGTVYSGPRQRGAEENFSVRAMCLHRDKVTGADRLFVTIGSLGIFSGVYDETAPGKIKWTSQSESGPVETRPLAIIEADGDLFFSAGRKIYRRVDGVHPTYKIVADMSDLYPTVPLNATGGIRGLTAIPNPNDKGNGKENGKEKGKENDKENGRENGKGKEKGGKGQSLIFAMWAGKPCRGDIYRLDPSADGGFTRVREACLGDLMSRYLSGNPVNMVGAAYSDFHPVTDPVTGETVHLIGFESWITGKRFPTWGGVGKGGFYAGAMVAIRDAKGRYRLREINGRSAPGKPVLVAPYCFMLSPFAADGGRVIYFGGMDANKKPATNMAWIFSARLEDFLRDEPGRDY